MTTLTPSPRAPRRTRSVAREALVSDAAAAEFFNTNVGAGGWAYDDLRNGGGRWEGEHLRSPLRDQDPRHDDRADIWLVPDAEYDGPGLAYWIHERAGTYFHAVVPREWIQ